MRLLCRAHVHTNITLFIDPSTCTYTRTHNPTFWKPSHTFHYLPQSPSHLCLCRNQWAGNYTNGPREESDFNFVRVLAALAADGFNTDSGGRSLVPGEPGYTPQQPQVTHGFDGRYFVQFALDELGGRAFNGHDLLDQPEHAAGCPAGKILGGWVGEGGGPTTGGGGLCVECAKWIEPRHTSQFVQRNAVERQPALKWSFANGLGYVTWESVWGSWNGVSPLDGETIRRLFTVMRQFRGVITSCDYQPFYPVTGSAGVVPQATMFPTPSRTLWVVVNPGSGPLSSYNLTIPPEMGALRYFDVWRGVEVGGSAVRVEGGTQLVVGGQQDEYGAVAAVSEQEASSPAFTAFLARMANMTRIPLAHYSADPVTSQNFTFETNVDPPAPRHLPASTPPATVSIPGTSAFRFQTQNLLGEPHLLPRYFGRPAPPSRAGAVTDHGLVSMAAFEMDTYPVTNAQFADFLSGSGYRPADPINFVRHWRPADKNATTSRPPPPRPPPGTENQPVVWVGFEDAQRYCLYRGRRLPNEWEWSFAARGNSSNETATAWPWGDRPRAECMPPAYTGRDTPPLPDVDAFDGEGCASPYGVQMLVGTVWQWTNAMHDAHTRAGLVKGGSSYWRHDGAKEPPRAGAPCYSPDPYYCGRDRSPYFFPNCASRTFVNWKGGDQHAPVTPTACQGELLLMDGGYERAATVSFRCARSLGPQPPQPPPPPPPQPAGWPRVFALGLSFNWTDGSPPNAVARDVCTGVYAPYGFRLGVNASDNQSHVLSLFVGAFCWGARLTATTSSGQTESKTIGTAPVCQHTPAATQNVVWRVTFSGPLTLTWARDRSEGRDGGGQQEEEEEEEEEGNLTWQAAALALSPDSTHSCPSGFCVADAQRTTGDGVDLTASGTVDWAHWGGVAGDGASRGSSWYTDTKQRVQGSVFTVSLLSTQS